MINLDSLKQFDPTTIDLSALDLRNITLPKFEKPAFDMPIDTDRLVGLARDAAYIGVGAVVVVAHEADERLRSVAETVTARARRVADAVR